MTISSSGDVTATGSYTANTHFKSSDGNATLSATGGGGVYLRPDGSTSSTTELFIQSGTGNAEFSGSVTAPDEFRGEVVAYANNQDAPYMIAGTSGYTGATTNWNTFGFQHRIKTSSTGIPRVTIDTHSGEAFSIDNNHSAVFSGSLKRGNMTIDSSEIDVSSGDLTLDVAGKINLDAGGGNIDLKEGGTTFGRLQEMIGGLGISAGSTPTFAQLISSTKTLFFGHIEIGDNKHVRWGNGNGDLQIYHDGSDSYIEEYGTGALKILTNGLRVRNQADDEDMITANQNGAVNLFHDNTNVLQTMTGGVNITGELQSDSLDVDGVADIAGNTSITGNTSSGNAFAVNRGDGGGQALRVDNTGKVVASSNYLYAASSGTSFYSQGDAVFRSSIRNDQSNMPVLVSDGLNVTGYIQSNGTNILNPTGRVLQNVTGNISMFTNDSGYITSASLPSVGNGTLTVQGAGSLSGSGTFTANQSGNTTITLTGSTDASTLDGIDSSQFLRSDADDSVVGGKKTTLHQLRFRGVGTNSNAGNDGYAFYQEAGAWSSPFPDLLMGYHTGVKFGAHKSYGGIRFYNDHPYNSSATKIFSVGEGDNNVRIQLGDLYFSSTTSNKAWHAGNDGSGSGLDADTVDGVHASSFLTGNQTITLTGPVTGSGTTSISTSNPYQNSVIFGGSNGSSPDSSMEYQQTHSISDTKLAPDTNWNQAIRMGHGDPYNYYSSTLSMQMTGSGSGKLRTQLIHNGTAQGWRTVWDNVTDGSGSGLDADTLDGQHGSYYAPASSIPSVGNGTITINAGSNMSGGGTFTVNQSGNTTITLNSTASGGGNFVATDADSTVQTNKKIQFRDGSNFINSHAGSELGVNADESLHLNAASEVLVGGSSGTAQIRLKSDDVQLPDMSLSGNAVPYHNVTGNLSNTASGLQDTTLSTSGQGASNLGTLGVDKGGRIVRGEQEETFRLSRSQLSQSFGGSGYTIIAAPGAGKTIVVTDTIFMVEFTAANQTVTASGNQLIDIRMPSGISGDTGILSTLPASQVARATQVTLNGSSPYYTWLYRDVPTGSSSNAMNRIYRENAPITIHRGGTNSIGTGITAVYVKIKYKVYDSTTF